MPAIGTLWLNDDDDDDGMNCKMYGRHTQAERRVMLQKKEIMTTLTKIMMITTRGKT